MSERKKRILFVDDDPALGRLAQRAPDATRRATSFG
jgi:hypothetical protein